MVQTMGGAQKKKKMGGPLSKTLTLFMTKICDFRYTIYLKPTDR